MIIDLETVDWETPSDLYRWRLETLGYEVLEISVREREICARVMKPPETVTIDVTTRPAGPKGEAASATTPGGRHAHSATVPRVPSDHIGTITPSSA